MLQLRTTRHTAAAYLHSAHGAATLQGRLMFTEVLQPEVLAQTAPE